MNTTIIDEFIRTPFADPSAFGVPASAGPASKSEISNLKSSHPSSPSLPSVGKQTPEDQLARLHLLRKYAEEFSKGFRDDHTFSEATVAITAMEFYSVLSRSDTRAFSKRLEEKPELFFQLIASFCQFSRMKLERDKFEFKKQRCAARQREKDQTFRARKPILITKSAVTSAFSSITSTARILSMGNADVPPLDGGTHRQATVTADLAETICLSARPAQCTADFPSSRPSRSSFASVKPPDPSDEPWHDPVIGDAAVLVSAPS